MANNTYVALAKVTASGSSTSQLVMSSIPATYTDLILVCSYGFAGSGGTGLAMQFNGDTAGNYTTCILEGNGSAISSNKLTGQSYLYFQYNSNSTLTVSTINSVVHIQNYASTDTKKPVLIRTNGSQFVQGISGNWNASPAAINTISVFSTSGNIASGSTFSLYGIKAEVGDSTPKATGGTVTSDATYWYHAFTTVGNFVPSQTLSCDILTIAGGGGSGKGGGGAGGLVYTASQSLVNATSYTVLIGAGGAKGTFNSTNGVNGSNSNVTGGSLSLTAAVGGGGGGGANGANGTDGGSGGGAAYYYPSGGGIGGTGTSGQGNAGGSASSSGGSKYGSGGGGGFAAAGGVGTTTGGGAGGAGTSTYSSWGSVTSTGQNVSGTYYYCGGGGGGADAGTSGAGGNGGGGAGVSYLETPNAGLASTGGGAGGNNNAAGTNGGSGLVIIRYAK